MICHDNHLGDVNGTKPKNGSSHAFHFLTVSILVDGARLVVGVLLFGSRSELPTLTLCVIEKVRELGVRTKDVTADAGFFSAEMIVYLQAEFEKTKLKPIIRMPINRKAKKMRLWEGRRFTYMMEDKKRMPQTPQLLGIPSGNCACERSARKKPSRDDISLICIFPRKKHLYKAWSPIGWKAQFVP